MSIDQGGPNVALGIDFGTSNTVAVARWPDGRVRPILVDGSPLLPSAVFADVEGNLLVGRDAVHSARLEPARFEPNPKRRVDDGLVLLGEREFNVVDLITGVLARVVEEWHRAVGPYRPETTLTCPATWGAARRTLLAEAAARAGLAGVRLVAEPVAAATYFAEVLGRDVPIGSVLMVHDFGAGTFDASLVSRTATGFEVLAVDGRDDLGGLDVDAALVEHLQADSWQRLLEPSTVEERRARRQLWDDVRIAKERLSRAQSADFVVPLLDTEVHLTRDELEQVARPVLEQTVRITRNLLKFADLPAGRLAGVFLVGGASRIPLMATLLHRELGEPPVVIEQPELVVAEGSILAGAALLTSEPAAPGPTAELRLPSRSLPEFAGPASSAGATRALPEFAEPGPSPASLAAPRALPDGADVADLPVVTQPVEAQSIPEVAGSSLPEVAGSSLPVRTPGAAAGALPEAEAFDEPTPIAPVSESRSGESRSDESRVNESRVNESRAAESRPPVAPVSGVPADGPPKARVKREPDVDNRETEIRPELVVPPHMRPPVDPWPDAESSHWRHDPDATIPTSPPHYEARTPVRGKPSGSKTNPGRPANPSQRTNPDQRTNPGQRANPVVAHARPISPGGAPARPVSGRAVVAAPRPPSVPQQQKAPRKAPKQQQHQPQQQRPQPKPKRRKSRVLRFFQLLLSMLTMICVPVVALIVAYGYGNPGSSWQQDAVNVFNEIRNLVHL
jgi:actin-like ATPase involved in cell morphogenesis